MDTIESKLGATQAARQLEHIARPHLDNKGTPIIPIQIHDALKTRAANAAVEAMVDVARHSGLETTDVGDNDFSSLESQSKDDRAFQENARNITNSRKKLHQLKRIYSRRKSKALRGLETKNTEKRNELLESIKSDLNKALSHLDKIIKVKDEYKKRLAAAKTMLALASTGNNQAITLSADGELEIDAGVMKAGYNVLMSSMPPRYTVGSFTNSSRKESDDREESIDQIVAELDTEIAVLRSEVENHKFEADLESAIIEYLEDGGKDEVARMRKNKDAEGFDKLVTDTLLDSFSGETDLEYKNRMMERVKQRVLELYDIPIGQISEDDDKEQGEVRDVKKGGDTYNINPLNIGDLDSDKKETLTKPQKETPKKQESPYRPIKMNF